MMAYHVSQLKRFYQIEATDAEKMLLEAIGINLRFEAISIGITEKGPTIALIPMDENPQPEKTAQLFAAAPDMLRFIKQSAEADGQNIECIDDVLTYLKMKQWCEFCRVPDGAEHEEGCPYHPNPDRTWHRGG